MEVVYRNVKTNVKNIPFGQNKRTKNVLFFLSRAPTHHSFTFNLRFNYELKHKVRLSKTVCGIFHFRFRFVFIKVYIFNKMHKIKILEKSHTVLLLDV